MLDAYAILALLGGEKGAHAAAELVSQARANLFVSAVNVGEVYYTLRRWRGESATVEAEAALYEHPRLQVMAASRERIRRAGEIKALGGLPLADAFAAALSLEVDAALVTADQEFRTLAASGLKVLWLLQ